MADDTSDSVTQFRVLLTPEEAAQRLALSRTTIYELIRTGELRSVKVGRARRIPVAALGEFVNGLFDPDPGGERGAA
jgi:excisionase family DNA binding protein